MPQMAEKTSPDAPPNCAVVPYGFLNGHAYYSTRHAPPVKRPCPNVKHLS